SRAWRDGASSSTSRGGSSSRSGRASSRRRRTSPSRGSSPSRSTGPRSSPRGRRAPSGGRPSSVRASGASSKHRLLDLAGSPVGEREELVPAERDLPVGPDDEET